MKKYKFVNDQHLEIFIKSRTFKGAVIVANAFMNNPACVGWCAYYD